MVSSSDVVGKKGQGLNVLLKFWSARCRKDSYCQHLNAILFLDEADAFMASRTELHGSHNRLVTVCLRKLEYYQGMLFLTSNRGIHFDEAIFSRTHFTIEDEDLTREFRGDLWVIFLVKARTMQGPAVVEEDDIQHLEKLALHGRKVKNIAAIAHALAEADAARVRYNYLESAAELNTRFSKEFGRQGPVDGTYV